MNWTQLIFSLKKKKKKSKKLKKKKFKNRGVEFSFCSPCLRYTCMCLEIGSVLWPPTVKGALSELSYVRAEHLGYDSDSEGLTKCLNNSESTRETIIRDYYSKHFSWEQPNITSSGMSYIISYEFCSWYATFWLTLEGDGPNSTKKSWCLSDHIPATVAGWVSY